MKRKIAVALTCAGLFMVPSCLTVDQSGLINLGEGLLCEVATSGLPFSNNLDYCSVIDIDIPVDLGA